VYRFTVSSQPVTIYKNIVKNVTVSAVQVGGVSDITASNQLVLTFSEPVDSSSLPNELGLQHIRVTDGSTDSEGKLRNYAIGAPLQGSGMVYTVPLTTMGRALRQGMATLTISDFGLFHVTNSPLEVQVYNDATQPYITDVTHKFIGSPSTTVDISLTFSEVMLGNGSPVFLVGGGTTLTSDSPYAHTWSEDKKTFTARFYGLAYETEYTVVVEEGGFPDRAENGVKGHSSYKFVTGKTPPTIYYDAPEPKPEKYKPYSYQLTARGALPMEWYVSDGSLPPGLTLSKSGLLSGTPTEYGYYSFSITVVNAGGGATTYFGSWFVMDGDPPPTPVPPPNPDTDSWVNPFEDVHETDWFYNDVKYVNAAKLIVGTSAKTFSPSESVTRAMVVTVLYRLEGSPEITAYSSPFTDVAYDTWYYDAVLWASDNSIALGYGGEFSPNTEVTRQDLATLVYRYQKSFGKVPPIAKDMVIFADDTRIAHYASSAIYELSKQGLISGKPGNKFDPQATATRAELAAILRRYMTALEKQAEG
jgi:hypothetical protein